MANELTDLDLGEWSICIDPANEDSTIEIVKSKSGLAPVLKETDMSDHVDTNDGEHEVDADFQAFAEAEGEAILNEFSELSEEDQAAALVGMAYAHDVQEAAIEDATGVIKSLTENTVPKEKHEAVLKTLRDAGAVIEKMKTAGHVTAEEGGLVDEIKKSLAPGQELSPEAEARITEVEKSLARQAEAESIAKAKTYGFGKPEDVAGLETRIRKGKTTAADGDLFVALVKQAGGLAKSSPLFKPLGEDAGADVDASPIAKMKSAAAEIRKAKPALTEQQAMSEAIDANPTLYSEYERSLRAAGRAA